MGYVMLAPTSAAALAKRKITRSQQSRLGRFLGWMDAVVKCSDDGDGDEE